MMGTVCLFSPTWPEQRFHAGLRSLDHFKLTPAGDTLSKAIDQWLEEAETPDAAHLRAIIGP